jgi:hypothetical protein
MIGVSGIGSVVDVATLFLVAFEIYRHRQKDEDAYAGLVAVAEHVPPALDDRLQADLDVDDRDIEAYQEG